MAFLGAELRRLNQIRAGMAKMKKKSDQYKQSARELADGIETLKVLGKTLGLFQQNAAELIEDFKRAKLAELGMTVEQVNADIEARTEARARKDYAEGDAIRDRLQELGILLHDTAEGTQWSVKFD